MVYLFEVRKGLEDSIPKNFDIDSMDLFKQGCGSNIYKIGATEDVRKSLSTILGDPIEPKYQVGEKVKYCGNAMTIFQVDPCQMDQHWKIIDKLQDDAGEKADAIGDSNLIPLN